MPQCDRASVRVDPFGIIGQIHVEYPPVANRFDRFTPAPLQFVQSGLALGNLQIERSAMEQAIKQLEQQVEKLRDQIEAAEDE